ncbi:MAG: hypothetical protein U1G08_16745 [Verrucomicrobiota bacterium]
MSPILVGLTSAGCILGGALLGMALQRLLPGHHLGKEMQDLVKLSAGTIATLTALVLGLLVSSAKSSYDGINTGIVQGSAKIILLDRALSRVGPEAQPARDQLKRAVAGGIEQVWPGESTGTSSLTAFEKARGMELVQDQIRTLTPHNDVQKQLLAQSQQLANDLGQLRWLLIEQAHGQLPFPLLLILVFWLSLLFVSFGLFAPKNLTALVVLTVGSTAISAAIFLVMELSEPLDGLIRVSSAPMRNALQHLSDPSP